MTDLPTQSILSVSAPQELNAITYVSFRDRTKADLLPEHQCLEVDLASTTFVDSSGLGALISLHKTMTARGGSVQLLRPRQPVLQLLELTRMHRLFEIIRAA
jgi:anti-sigma B factor antagonist